MWEIFYPALRLEQFFYCIQYILLWIHAYFLLIFITCTCRNMFTVNLRRRFTKMLRTCCEHTQLLSLERGTFAYLIKGNKRSMKLT